MSEVPINTDTIAVEEHSEFEDKTILCGDCTKDFIWSAGEQVFFRDKQLKKPPKR